MRPHRYLTLNARLAWRKIPAGFARSIGKRRKHYSHDHEPEMWNCRFAPSTS